MTMLICGLILFLGIHLVSIFAHDWRNVQFKKLSAVTWKGIYSLILVASLALITVGYLEAI